MTPLRLLKDPQIASTDISRMIESFLGSDHCASLSTSTTDLYTNALLKNFLPFCCYTHGIDAIDKSIVDHLPAYSAYLERKGHAGTTIQQYISIVKIMMKALGTPIEFTYRRKSEDRKSQKLKQMDRWFDEDDIEKCLSYEEPCARDRLIIRLLTETGARVQELSNLTWADVDLENNTLYLRTSKTQPRPSFFSDESAKLFKSLKKASLFDYYDDSPIFPSVSRMKSIVIDILQDLGLKSPRDGRGCHTFRHWAATYLYYTGDMRLTDIARLLGDKVETIRNTYLHPTPAMLRSRVSKAMGWDLKPNSEMK